MYTNSTKTHTSVTAAAKEMPKQVVTAAAGRLATAGAGAVVIVAAVFAML